jgi:hypothetical protein
VKFSIVTDEFNAAEAIGDTLAPITRAAGRADQSCRQRVEGPPRRTSDGFYLAKQLDIRL